MESFFANPDAASAGVAEAVTSFVKGLPVARLPLTPFTLSSPALGLLLVFRTNGAFQRFFEARALWGALINYSRNSVRQVRSECVSVVGICMHTIIARSAVNVQARCVKDEHLSRRTTPVTTFVSSYINADVVMRSAQALLYCENPKDVEEVTRRTIVFARSLKLHLRYDADKDEVAFREVRALCTSRNLLCDTGALHPFTDQSHIEKTISESFCLCVSQFKDLIGKDEAERLLSATHRPCQALADLTTVVRRNCKDDPLARLSFDRTLEQFSNQLGACERIFKTPLPLLYVSIQRLGV